MVCTAISGNAVETVIVTIALMGEGAITSNSDLREILNCPDCEIARGLLNIVWNF